MKIKEYKLENLDLNKRDIEPKPFTCLRDNNIDLRPDLALIDVMVEEKIEAMRKRCND